MSRGPRDGRQALSEQVVWTANALGAAAAGVGTTNTAVLRWLAAGIASVGNYISSADSATLGTVITISTPGTYRAEFMLPQVLSTSLLAGISIGATGAPITANPAMGVDGVFAVCGPNTLPAATAVGMAFGVTFDVTDAMQATPGITNALRFHATNNAGATPVASFTAAGAWARIIRICDKGA